MPLLAALTVADDAEAWRRAGFSVDDGGRCRIGSVEVRISPPAEGRSTGVKAWALELDRAADVEAIDGIPTEVEPVAEPAPSTHPNGSRLIDHVVVMTPDVDRSAGVLGQHGFTARRTRDGEAYGMAMRQVFFRMGEVILELVGPPEPMGEGRARFYGLALTVEDLDATAARLGEHLGAVKEAVQPGRRIATLRASAGLGTPIAFMSAGDQEYGAPA